MAHRHTILLERTINTLMNTSKMIQDISDVPLGSRVGGASLAQAYRMLALSVQVPSSQNLKKKKVAVTPTQTMKYINSSIFGQVFKGQTHQYICIGFLGLKT